MSRRPSPESAPLSLPPPEFSRLVVVETMTGDEQLREIVATPAECQALATRFRLLAIEQLSATLKLRRLDGGRLFRVSGRLSARVVQACVVTLEPVPETLDRSFAALFTTDPALLEDGGEIVLDLGSEDEEEDEDLPEPIVAGRVDIGELVAQHLSLALDPYPRQPGLSFEGFDDDANGAASPFQVLAALKERH